MAVLVPVSILVPIITGLLRYRLLSTAGRILFYYLLISAGCSTLIVGMANRHMNNLPVFHFFTAVEFMMLACFFIQLFSSKGITKWLVFSGLAFIIFLIVNTVFIQSIYSFNTYSRSVEAIIIIVTCMYYMKQQLIKDMALSKAPGFWFVLGLFIYFSTSLTIFILSNISLHLNRSFDRAMWNIHAGMLLLMYLLFTKGFNHAKSK